MAVKYRERAVSSFVAVPARSVCRSRRPSSFTGTRRCPWAKTAHLAAASVEREAPTLTRRPSMVRLAGDVMIRIRVDAAARGTTSYIILHADQAVYHEDTGTIDAQETCA